VRSVAFANPILATSGSDEIIRLFDMYQKRELGVVTKHEGTVNMLRFLKRNHLITCSDDGNVCVFDARTWQCLKTLKGHKGAVTALSLHPSGKMALSVGKDKTLRTWNLVKGRSAFTTNIKKIADFVEFSPNGLAYAIGSGSTVDLYSVETAGITHSIDLKRRITNILYLNENILAVSAEGANVDFYSTTDGTLMHSLDTKTNRVRAMCFQQASSHLYFVTCSSDGFIKVFRTADIAHVSELQLVTEYGTGFRISCATIAVPKKPVKKQKKRPKAAIVDKSEDSIESTPSAKKKKVGFSDET